MARGRVCITAGLLLWLWSALGLADVHYVSDDGGDVYPYSFPATAAREIQDALDAAEPGDTVRVLPGMYHALPDTSWVVGGGIHLIGSGPAQTSLYGELQVGEAARVVGFRLVTQSP